MNSTYPISKRESLLEKLNTIFSNKVALNTNVGIQFSSVSRTPIGQLSRGSASMLGIYDGDEQKTDFINRYTECNLRVTFEFHVYTGTDMNSSTQLNLYLAAMERAIYADKTWGQMILDTKIIGNELAIDSMYEKQVSGVIYVMFKYRHKFGDPRSD